MDISEKIKHYRTDKQMTQKQLAFLSGVSESAIRMYELGARTPKLEQLQKISKALDISIYSLILPDLRVNGEMVKALYYADPDLKIKQQPNGKLCVEFSNSHLNTALKYWYNIQQKYLDGKLSQSDYNEWILNFPSNAAINAPEKYKNF